MTDRAAYVVVGGGPAGARAAEAIRKRDRDAPVVVLSADPHPLYNRILLSKQFLTTDEVGPEDVVMKPAEAWERQGIELRTSTRVAGLDPAAREVVLAGGQRVGYRACLVATGSRPIRLPVAGADAPGVRYLRTLDDALALRERAAEAERAVVVGGGLIGVEVAAALVERGVRTALVARETWLFGHLAPKPVGRVLERVLEEGGVELVLDTAVTAIERDGDGLGVHEAGGRVLEADLVPVGAGVAPATRFLDGTGLLDADGGIVVDARLRSAAPELFAAGDVARWDDPVVGVRHRVEHWTHALHQGRRAGENMVGDPEPYARVSSYDTTLFGTAVEVVGDPLVAEAWEAREGLEDAAGVALGSREGRIVAAYRIGDAELDRAALVGLVEAGEPADAA